MKQLILTTALGAIAAGGLATAATAQEAYFADKTIDVVVPFAVGGAVFVSAKFLEPFFEKHLPGNPDINVVERPGGGGILGANWFEENANADGTTILFSTSSIAHPYILGQDGVEYDLGSYRVVYSHPFGSVTYVSPDTGVTSHMDIREANRPLIYGGIAAAASDLPGVLSFEVLDLDVRSVMGFTGRGPVRLAFEQGETNLDIQFTPVYLTQVRPMVEEGRAVPLWTGGAADADGNLTLPDPVAPDLPSVWQVHNDLYGEAPSGVEWDAFQAIASVTYAFGLNAYAHPDTPQEAIDAFAAAVEAINADPEFQAESLKVTNGARLMAGPAVERSVKNALNPSDEVRQYLLGLLSDKFGVRF